MPNFNRKIWGATAIILFLAGAAALSAFRYPVFFQKIFNGGEGTLSETKQGTLSETKQGTPSETKQWASGGSPANSETKNFGEFINFLPETKKECAKKAYGLFYDKLAKDFNFLLPAGEEWRVDALN